VGNNLMDIKCGIDVVVLVIETEFDKLSKDM
jgi:hypothetical protein